jgi:hypothetical protein
MPAIINAAISNAPTRRAALQTRYCQTQASPARHPRKFLVVNVHFVSQIAKKQALGAGLRG